MPPVPGIVLDQLTKTFSGGVVAVDDVSLTIGDGEFLVLVGPSGCGKSTLLRMVAGLEEVSEGTISIDGRDVTDLPPRDRDVAMVFQNYALYPHKTVRENLGYGLKVRRTPKAEIDKRVSRVAEQLGLVDLLGRRPAALSGGQRQRVAMGRAIVREPKAFLMDEPLSNLDAKLRVGMRAQLSALHARLRTTTIYVTHDQIEAMTMADRIAVLRLGVLEQIGSPRELYEQPQNRFVAGFIGSPAMNFLEFEVKIEDGDVSLVGGDVDVRLNGDQAASLAASGLQRVVLGVRPEHLRLRQESDRGMHVSTVVDVAEFLGNGDLLYATADGVDLVALVDDAKRVSVGDHVTLHASPGALYFFTTESGEVIATGGNGSREPARE
jgi:multiple sugar transport system ATP-binding protein